MRTKKGTVSSAKMTGSVSVSVDRHVFHPIYKKRFRRSRKFLCDNNGLDLYVGDQVVITECKPISKNKYFQVTEITKAAPRVSDMKEDAAIEKVLHREKTGADAKVKEKAEEAAAKKEAKKDDKTTEKPTTTKSE
jgi:small subunit ribosomal protein S17